MMFGRGYVTVTVTVTVTLARHSDGCQKRPGHGHCDVDAAESRQRF